MARSKSMNCSNGTIRANKNFLVVGPWNHGGWSRGEGQKLGRIDFGSPTAEYYRSKCWCASWLITSRAKGAPIFPRL